VKAPTITLLAALALGTVATGGYWLGARSSTHASAVAVNPAAPAPAVSPARKLLYYRNPMGLADTSPVPKKDPMGMDYIPVYEGEDPAADADAPNTIRISTEKVQKLGVRTEAAAKRQLGKTVRAAGRVEPDERRISTITPKFEGYVERLHVNVTGQPVAKGQPLFEVYSPELVSAQREYLIALQGLKAMHEAGADAQASMRQLADSALTRMRNWDLPAEQIDSLVRTGQPTRTITFRSPASGVVTEKKAVQGMRFMPGEMLYQVTELSSVWVIADVAEQDLGAVRNGARASVRLAAFPSRTFDGRITYVYPTLKAETRTVPVRVELANPGQLLKPAMFAQVEVASGSNAPVLTVPDSAVIDSGTRRIVLVQRGEGRFEPREVELGERGTSYVEILKGVSEGEQVVVAANFLIDAESNLKAAVGGLGAHGGHGGTSKDAAAPAGGSVGHKGVGTVEGIDAKAGTLRLNHGAVASMKWPAMTMEFKVANSSLLKDVQPGQRVAFEFVARSTGDYVVTSIGPESAQASATKATERGATSPPAPGGAHPGH
jgi:Cu(I)/Ag(I) efflux system membrane fusion protein